MKLQREAPDQLRKAVERRALSFLTCPERFLSDHCLHLLSLCTAFSLLTMAPACLFFPLPLFLGLNVVKFIGGANKSRHYFSYSVQRISPRRIADPSSNKTY